MGTIPASSTKVLAFSLPAFVLSVGRACHLGGPGSNPPDSTSALQGPECLVSALSLSAP